MSVVPTHYQLNLPGPGSGSLCQDVAERVLSLFTTAVFFKMLASFDKYKKILDPIVCQSLKVLPQSLTLVPLLAERDPENMVSPEAYEALRDSLERVTSILRFLGVLLNSQSEGLGLETPFNSKDVLKIVSYKGKQHLEKSFQDLVNNNPRIRSLCDEVVRTATSSLTMQPVKDRALSTLKSLQDQSLEMTPDRLDDLVKQVPDLRNGLREIEMEEFNGIFVKLLSEETRKIIDGKTRVTSSRFVGVLLSGLAAYKNIPIREATGLHDLHDRLQQWSSTHRTDTVLCDLVDCAKCWLEKNGGVADLNEVSDLMSQLKKVKIDTANHEHHFAALCMLVTSLRGYNAEASWHVKAHHSTLQQPVILRRQGLLQQVAALVYDAKDDVQYKVVCSHLAVIKNAVLLSQSIHRLESLGEGDLDRAKKDKKRTMISQVLAAGTSYSKAVSDLAQLKSDNMPDDQDL
eukprot:s552_g3.t1